MDHAPLRRAVALALSLAILMTPLPALAQIDFQGCLANPNPPFIDNRDGYFVNYEEAPNHPMELSWNGRRLYVTNIPDSRVSVFDITSPGNPVLIREIAVGLGPVTVRRRPEQVIEPTPVELRTPLSGDSAKASPAAGAPALVPSHALGARALAEPVTVHQLWVVSMSSNALFVIDESTLRVVDSVRLPHRPSGLVFDTAGDFAYVTLSDSNRVAKINANNPHAAPVFFEFESEMPLGTGVRTHVEEPRGLMIEGDDLYVLSYLSGNGTTGNPFTLEDADIENQWNFPAGNPAPPDRDVLQFDVSGGTAPGSAVLWRMGTLNFDLARGGPDGEVYVTTVDLRNEDEINEGEPQYQINSGVPGLAFAMHAVTHAVPSATGTPQAGTVVVDLNDPVNHAAGLNPDFRCAGPNDLLFTADGNTAFVACNETRNVAMFDAVNDRVAVDFAVGSASRSGFGIRGVALDPSEDWLYAYGRGDNTLLVFDTRVLPVGAPKRPSRVLSVGFDITTDRIENGRRHFLDASNSSSGLMTCNTCHPDLHLDGVAWDLSDFTGDLVSDPKDIARIPKGAKVTMSLLGIEETPPFHWRGDRADLDAFDPAFEGLLGGQRLDDPEDPDDPELDELLAFVFSSSYPPNPNQSLDRSYSLDAEIGFDCFSMETAHEVSKDTTGLPPNPPQSGLLSVTCEDCHSMAGASGTLNQVNNPIVGLLADDATQLRGLWDKVSDTVDFGLTNPCGQPPGTYCNNGMTEQPVLGWGLANTGFVDTLIDFINLGVFNGLPAGSQPKIEQLITELDTGSAPTTAATHHLNGNLPAGPPYPSPVQELLDGAANGDNDLVVRGWITWSGAPRPIGMLYDPFAAGGAVFVTDTLDNPAAGCTGDATVTPGPGGIGPFTLAQLDSMAGAGTAELALIGTPVGSGYRFGLDREMDCLPDGDEAAHGTSLLLADSDNDTFPDGYEVRLGSNPTSSASTPTDNTDPGFGAGVISWFNSNVVKARWTTDEESKSRIRVYEQPPSVPQETLVYENHEDRFKRYHVMVARKLAPGRSYRVEVEAEDPSGRTAVSTLGTFTTQSHLFQSVHMESTVLAHLQTNPGGTERYRATLHVVDEDGQDVQGAEVTFGLLEWNVGLDNLQIVFPLTATTNASGIATLDFDGILLFGAQHGIAEAVVTDVQFPGPTPVDTRLYFHSLDGQFGHWNQTELYPPP